jgi:hypothetical protein
MTVTSLQTMGPGPIIERFIISEADLTAAGTTQTIDLKSLPKGTIVKGVRVKASVAFAGGGNTAVTVSVGSAAGTSTTFSAAFDIFQAVGDTVAQMTSGWKAATYAADTLQAFFTVTTGTCAGLTVGQVAIDVEYQFMESLTDTAPAGNSLTGGGLL